GRGALPRRLRPDHPEGRLLRLVGPRGARADPQRRHVPRVRVLPVARAPGARRAARGRRVPAVGPTPGRAGEPRWGLEVPYRPLPQTLGDTSAAQPTGT